MTLYHGSKNPSITTFELHNNRSNLDFGKGVYLTTDRKQAEKWATRDGTPGAVYVFEVDISDLVVVEYKDEDLDYILYLCRIDLEDVAKETIPDFDTADIIFGQVLDGTVWKFEKIAERFNCGDADYETLRKKISLFDKKDQWCFKTNKAIELLNNSLKEVKIVEPEDPT